MIPFDLLECFYLNLKSPYLWNENCRNVKISRDIYRV